MPPCVDVYVLVRAADRDRASVLATFIDRYADTEAPGDPRFASLVRVLVDERPAPGDADALAGLRRGPDTSQAFSIYLRARAHHAAIVTLTEEGDLVLGLSLDDPDEDPEIVVPAGELIGELERQVSRCRRHRRCRAGTSSVGLGVADGRLGATSARRALSRAQLLDRGSGDQQLDLTAR